MGQIDFYYFAYGSLLSSRSRQLLRLKPLETRVVFARGYRVACEVAFGVPPLRVRGLATLVPTNNAITYGLLLRLRSHDQYRISLGELVPFGLYRWLDLIVESDDGITNQAASTCVGRTSVGSDRPPSWYRKTVLQGAVESGLPETWIAQLRRTMNGVVE